MSESLTSLEPVILIVALITFIYVRRFMMWSKGVPISVPRLFGYGGLVVVLFAFTVALGLNAFPWYALPLYLGVLAAIAVVGTLWVRKSVQIEERSPGQWYYKLGIVVPIVYLVLFIVRMVLDFVVLDINPFAFGGTLPALTSEQVTLFMVVDTLFAVSTGLIVGRAVGVYLKWQEAQRAEAKQPPLASGPSGS
jgi:hypothetical protein